MPTLKQTPKKETKKTTAKVVAHVVKKNNLDNPENVETSNIEHKHDVGKEYGTKEPKRGKGNRNLIVWIIILFVLLAGLAVYSILKINKLEDDVLSVWVDNILKPERETVRVYYGGKNDASNNVKRIGDLSLGFPDAAKGKRCYVLGDKIRGTDGGAVGGYLGTNSKNNRYSYAESYEVTINNADEKLEVAKNSYTADNNLTQAEKDKLYLSFTMLCSY